MRLCCPECHQPLHDLVCPNHHAFEMVGGVLILLNESFGRRLQLFTAQLEEFRAAEGKRILDSSVYERLPDAPAVRNHFEWRLRRYDLAVILRLLHNRPRQRILDVGAWNGWLSHRLAAEGHLVTAVDYFTDCFDGLGARAFYSTSWQAIQMDLTDLSSLDQPFDVIVLNRCLQFFPNPEQYVAQASTKLTPGGLLVATGLAFYQDSTAKLKEIRALQKRYRRQYGTDIFLHPCKGYLDFSDHAKLAARGLQFRRYHQLIPANLKSLIWPTLPRYYYGIHRAYAGA